MPRRSATVQDARQPGWFYLDDRLLDTYGATIGPIGIAVYAALARHAKANGQASIAYNHLAESIGASRNTVITTLRKLADAGLITITAQTDDRGNSIAAHLYTLCVIPEQKRVKQHRGVPADAPPVPTDGTPIPAAAPPVPTDGWGVPTDAYIGHDSFSKESDPPPPTPPNPPMHNGVGGGGFDPEVARIFATYEIKQAEPLARLYAECYPTVTPAEIRTLCARLDDPTAGPYRGSRLYRVLKLGPPEDVPKASARAPIPEPPRIAYPPDVLTPQQAAATLAKLRKKQHEATHEPT